MMKYFKLIAAAATFVASVSAYAQTQTAPKRFDDSTGIRPWTGIVQIGLPGFDPNTSGSGGAGTWCGLATFWTPGDPNIFSFGNVIGRAPVSLTSEQTCQGVSMGAAWPNKKCPDGFKFTMLNANASSGGMFGSPNATPTYVCMAQPEGASPWVQNVRWNYIGDSIQYPVCDYYYTSRPGLARGYREETLMSNNSVIIGRTEYVNMGGSCWDPN